LTAPQDTKDKIQHKLPHPANKNFGMSRQPVDEPEEEKNDAVDRAVEGAESIHHEAVEDRPWQGSESFKTPRESHPGGDMALEDRQEHHESDNITRQKNPTEKGAAYVYIYSVSAFI